MNANKAARIHITGIVQGVGFRPFVYGLATQLGISGWVRNTSAGVDIVAEGLEDRLKSFVNRLAAETPPLAQIDELTVDPCPPDGFEGFQIIHSEPIPGAFQPVSPDVSICADCLQELFNPQDRRFRYPFINCTNCGPRFTIIEDIPYDRPNTTMAAFQLCPDCAAEYHDPADRRFHAQPVACPACGPHVWLEPCDPGHASRYDRDTSTNETTSRSDGHFVSEERAIQETQKLLANGKIVAIKGLGGFHLACDATNARAVAELRERKLRVDKPFALMMPDLHTVKSHCLVNEAEARLLQSRQRPVVILRRRPDSPISADVAPNQDTLGVMLPYTPLHYLLFVDRDSQITGAEMQQAVLPPLVMTSGNLSEEPIATDNEEARQRLASLADAFLMHNRPIHTRCDDSVVRSHLAPTLAGEHNNQLELPTVMLRRARGYAPFPVLLPRQGPALLATGPELKNTFCLTRQRYAFISQHIGDMENYETMQSFEQGIDQYERLFHVQPEAIAYDLHPNYLATRYALDRAARQSLPAIGVQHHHAHIAACMAENGLSGTEPVIGVAFDGTGYGDDGAIWGGEFLLADYSGYRRMAHLTYMPLPGGDAAIRKPARIALAYLWQTGLDWESWLPPVGALCAEERTALHSQLTHQINVFPSSSMGRLFDAVASLVGVRHEVNYEAQAAIELEALVTVEEKGVYPFELADIQNNDQLDQSYPSRTIQILPMLRSVQDDLRAGVSHSIIASRFHNTVARIVLEVCQAIRTSTAVPMVVLSGGVWQNNILLNTTLDLLQEAKFNPIIHHRIPPNDGGVALGQAAIAISYLNQ